MSPNIPSTMCPVYTSPKGREPDISHSYYPSPLGRGAEERGGVGYCLFTLCFDRSTQRWQLPFGAEVMRAARNKLGVLGDEDLAG